MESLNASSALLLQEEAEGLFGCVSTFKKLNVQENVMLKFICTLNVDSHGIQKAVQLHQKNSEMRQKKDNWIKHQLPLTSQLYNLGKLPPFSLSLSFPLSKMKGLDQWSINFSDCVPLCKNFLSMLSFYICVYIHICTHMCIYINYIYK